MAFHYHEIQPAFLCCLHVGVFFGRRCNIDGCAMVRSGVVFFQDWCNNCKNDASLWQYLDAPKGSLQATWTYWDLRAMIGDEQRRNFWGPVNLDACTRASGGETSSTQRAHQNLNRSATDTAKFTWKLDAAWFLHYAVMRGQCIGVTDQGGRESDHDGNISWLNGQTRKECVNTLFKVCENCALANTISSIQVFG